MTLPIRAFMMIRSGPDDWFVSVCRDFEAVLEAWTARADPLQTAVLHIGFGRPSSAAFEAVAQEHPSRLLVTGSTKFGLPDGYEASADPIGFVENLPIHMGTRGWGYVVEEEDLRKVIKHHAPILHIEASGWVANFLALHPDFADPLEQANIFDENSYIEAERALPWEPRYRAGLFRFHSLIGMQDNDPTAIARAAPPWLEGRLVETMNLSVRVANVLSVHKVKKVADLQWFKLESMLSLVNFGRKSAGDLRDSLMSALNEGPDNISSRIEQAGHESLRVKLHKTLATLNAREGDILRRRMGLGRPQETLQAISDDYDISRERIRQIESKVVTRLIKEAHWDDLLTEKLGALLVGREFPLPVLGIEAVDNWFSGVSDWPEALHYILENFCANTISIVNIEGIEYFGFLDQAEWEVALAEANRLLSNGADEKWMEDHCKAVVTPLIKEGAQEFRGLLWEKATNLCHFAENDLGQRALVAYGRGADQVVEAVLSDSDCPLHYSEIAERASERLGRPVDLRRAQNSAAVVGILFARGTYGLAKHVALSPDDADLIREEAESIILAGPPGRQWHAAEIVADLLDRDTPIGNLDKYTLDFLLRKSGVLQRLGRMTWVEAHPDAETSVDRINILQTVVSLIKEAGRPLSTSEIRHRLVALRGMNEVFQFVAGDPLIRLGTAVWGLNDRDIPIKRCDQPGLIEDLVMTLQNRGSGIHISEVEDATLQAWPSLTAQMIFSLANLDARMRCKRRCETRPR